MARLKILPHTKQDLEHAQFGSAYLSGASARRVAAGLTVSGRGEIDLERTPHHIKDFLTECPRAPGVYGMFDALGKVIYIGKSKNLRARLSRYVNSATFERKEARIKFQAQQIIWEELPDEFGALIREIELIDILKPKLNIRDNPNRRSRAYLALCSNPLPHFVLTRSRPYRALEAAGPLFPSREFRDVVHKLNDLYRLIDCPQPTRMQLRAGESAVTSERGSPGCIRAEINKCSAPCAAWCGSNDYETQVTNARRFFYSSKELNREIKDRIKSAVDRLAFEEAMELEKVRGLCRNVRRSIDVVARRRAALTFVYKPDSRTGMEHWYIINRGSVEAIVPVPRDSAARAGVLQVIRECQETDAGRRAPLRETASTTEAWFTQNPRELALTRSFSEVISSVS